MDILDDMGVSKLSAKVLFNSFNKDEVTNVLLNVSSC